MNKLLKNIGKCVATLVLVLFAVVGVSQSAYAVDLSFTESFWAIQDWDDAKMYIENFWRKSYDFNNGIEISRDELDDLCVSLNEAGFPCAVAAQSNSSGVIVYYIIGNGSVPVELAWGNTRTLDISYLVHTNIKGAVYYAQHANNISDTLDRIDYALNGANGPLRLFSDLVYYGISMLDEHIEVLVIQLESIRAYLNGDEHGTPNVIGKLGSLENWASTLSLQLADVVTAIQNISINGDDSTFNFDTAPITDKLDEVTTTITASIEAAADDSEILSWLSTIARQLQYGGASPSGPWHPTTLYDFVSEMYSKVTDIPLKIDGLAYSMQTLITEVQKISTHSVDVEAEVMLPGVLGGVEASGTDGWTYDDLTFTYSPDQALLSTGDVSFADVATKTADTLYTNLLPLAVDTDLSTIYNDVGYKTDTRLASTGGAYSYNNLCTTGFIPVTVGDIVRITGITHSAVSEENFLGFNSKGELTGAPLILNYPANPSDREVVLTEDIFSADIRYIRFSAGTIDENTIVTVNEEIIGGAQYVLDLSCDEVDLTLDRATWSSYFDSTTYSSTIFTLTDSAGVEMASFTAADFRDGVHVDLSDHAEGAYTLTVSGDVSIQENLDAALQAGLVISTYAWGYPTGDTLHFTVAGTSYTVPFADYSVTATSGDCVIYDNIAGKWYFHDVDADMLTELVGHEEVLTTALTSSPALGTVLETRVYTWFEWFYDNVDRFVVESCEHAYVTEVSQEATCILPGLQTYTCSNCGSSYSEILPSIGHDWQCTGHVAEELDPATGEVITAGYDVYTCSICHDTYNDYDGTGAPESESDTVTGLIGRVFEKIGTLAGKLVAMVIRLLDKLLAGFDQIVTDFNTKTEQIVSFGGDYPMWLAGLWVIIPADLQLALGFCVVVMCLAIIGKKVVFS